MFIQISLIKYYRSANPVQCGHLHLDTWKEEQLQKACGKVLDYINSIKTNMKQVAGSTSQPSLTHTDINKTPTNQPCTRFYRLTNTTAVIRDSRFNALLIPHRENTGPVFSTQIESRNPTRGFSVAFRLESNMLTDNRLRPSPVLERDRGCCKLFTGN